MIRVLVCDGHAAFRQGLKLMFCECPDITVTGEAGSSDEVYSKVWKDHYDAVVLDLRLAGGKGFDLLKEIKALRPRLPVVVTALNPDREYAVRSLEAGASGYVAKQSVAEDLAAALRTVCEGGRCVIPPLPDPAMSQGVLPGKGYGEPDFA